MKLALGLLLLSAVGAAGCGHPWQVVRDTPPPSPLKGAGPLTVSFDYSRLVVGGMNEQAFVQSKMAKDPSYDQSWMALKGKFEQHFIMGLLERWAPGAQPGPAGGPGVHLTVFPTSLSMGHYMVIASTATTVQAHFNFTVDGREAEEILMTGAEGATVFTPSVEQHMPRVAAYLGRNTGAFLATKK